MPLQHLRSSTANKRPTPASMSDGQIAINSNLASPGLFFKDSNGALVKVGPAHVGTTAPNVSPAAGGQTGNSIGELWLDTSGTNPVLKTWNGSSWLAVQPVASGNVVTTADTGTVTSAMIADGTIVNADINASAAIADTKLGTIATAGKVSNSATTATSANTASAIVARDGSGNFSAGTITSASGGFRSVVGTVAAPALSWTGDTDTGIYSPSADQVGVSVGGTLAMRFTTTSNNTNKNIYVLTPEDVAASSGATTQSSNQIYWRGKYWDGAASVNVDWNTVLVPTDTAGNAEWRLRVGSTNQLTVNNAGVARLGGLGTAALPALSFTGDTNTGIYSPGADQVAISTNGARRLVIDANGRVGLNRDPLSFENISLGGTTTGNATQYGFLNITTCASDVTTSQNGFTTNLASAASSFTLTNRRHFYVETDTLGAGSSITNSVGFGVSSGLINAANNYGFWSNIASGTGRWNFYSNGTADSYFASNNFIFANGGTERARIDSNGRLGLGTSSPARRLTVSSTDGVSIAVENTTNFIPATLANYASSIEFRGDKENRYTGAGAVIGPLASISTVYANTTFASDNDQGAGALVFSTRARTSDTASDVVTERVRIDDQGRVGIGTTSPATLLHLSSATGSASPTPTELRIATTTNASDWSNTGSWGRVSFYNGDTSGGGPKVHAAIDAVAQSSIGTTSRLSFKVANDTTTALNEVLTMTFGGAVGIGTASPQSLLHAQQGTDGEIFRLQRSGGTNIPILRVNLTESTKTAEFEYTGSDANGNIAFKSGATERARIDSSGRLLVGTSSALTAVGSAYHLQVAGTGFATSGQLLAGFSTNAAVGGSLVLAKSRNTTTTVGSIVSSGDRIGGIFFAGDDGAALIRAAQISVEVDGTPGADDMPGRLVFSTTADGASSPTERMRIGNNGTIRCNTGGDGPTGVPGTEINSDGYIFCSVNGGSAGFFNRFESDGAVVTFRRSNTNVGTISVTTIATAYNTSSDYRLKENVVPLSGAIDRLQQIPVYRFNFIADPDTVVDGFIAHEAQEIVPECVTGTKDEVDEDGNPVYQGIDQSKLVPLLTAALQEALAKIETLEARLDAAGIS